MPAQTSEAAVKTTAASVCLPLLGPSLADATGCKLKIRDKASVAHDRLDRNAKELLRSFPMH
jgi:hypothetical protein